MRLHPRRHRPQTAVALLVIVFILTVLVWSAWEVWLLARTHRGRLLVGSVSATVFLSFAICWMFLEVR